MEETTKEGLPMPPPRITFPTSGGPTALRKTETEKKRFTMLDMTLQEDRWKKNLTERMRELDDIRMRVPVPEECTELNIPDSRLNLHSLQNILLLCGGCVGVRFTGDELPALIASTTSCEALFVKIDSAFKALPTTDKNRRLHGPYEVIESTSSSSVRCTHPDDIAAGSESNEIANVQYQLDGYIDKMRQLQTLVRTKNATLPSPEERLKYQGYGKDPDAIEGAASQPQWLSVLMAKYSKAVGLDTDESSVQTHGHGKITLGKLAAYFSCIAMGLFACSADEKDAFFVILHASNDVRHTFSFETDEPRSFIDRVGHSFPSTIAAQQYWSKRFYNFLRTLTELKSMKEDEKSINQFDSFHA